jgi:DNA invertase Pin-like site-specific DNA recombinase
MTVYGYCRVSTDDQTIDNQKVAILEWAAQNKMSIDHWITVSMSTRKDLRSRKVDELLSRSEAGDAIVLSELSRLGRSVGQIAILVDQLIQKGVALHCLKECIHISGSQDLQTEVMVTMFSLFGSIERRLISMRTKEALSRARAEGKTLGRPRGSLGKSKLDGREEQIKEMLALGVSKASIAKICGAGYTTLLSFIRSRGLQ